MSADGPAAEKINIAVHHTVRVVAGEAESAIRTITYQKVLHDPILALYVRIVASVALHISPLELHRWIGCVGRRGRQQYVDFRRVRQRSLHADRMRTAKITAELGGRLHRPRHVEFSISHRLAGSDRAVVAAETQLAGASQGRLHSR